MVKKAILLISVTVLSFFMAGGLALAEDPAPQSTAPTGTAPNSLFTSSKDAACGGSQASDSPVNCSSSNAQTTINKIITFGLNILSIIIGLAAVVMIMVGGFKFVSSQGESANIASARNTILYAIVGLVIVALAQFIVRFVLVKATPKSQTPAAPTTMINDVNPLDVVKLYVV